MTTSISQYQFLLGMIRSSSTLTSQEKNAMIGRLESGEWGAAIQEDILNLCKAEVQWIQARRKQIQSMKEKQEVFLEQERNRIAPDAEHLTAKLEEQLQNVTDQFEIECLQS